jgi:hypothetical protein
VTRVFLACDACERGAWIGPAGSGWDAWCERCQLAVRLEGVVAGADEAARCAVCGERLALEAPRFEEWIGELQNLVAVARAWAGDPKPLGEILPERPRFLTDLTPPTAELGDPVLVRDAMSALARGGFVRARALLETAVTQQPDEGRFWHALAIAAERTAEPALAEIAYARAIEHAGVPTARLARGALRARRGDFAGAREDLALAGDGREASWNRAATTVLEAVATTPGLPDARVLERARAEAGPASSYWSDHTVGRLLWTLLVERAEARARKELSPCPDARVLRAAESAFEFDTFWDRALVVHGYARLGLTADVARVAAPLARELVAALLAEPAMKGASAREIAEPLATAAAAIDFGRPDQVAELLEPVMARDDLRHYRVPCAHCGRGSVGVERIEDDDAGAED